MKKTFLIFFLFFVITGQGQTLIDSYSESNYNANQFLRAGDKYACGQSFANTVQIPLNSCKFYIRRVGSPTGNIYAKLYAHRGTYGTATGLPVDPPATYSAISDAIDISTISTSYALVTFTFSGANKVTLSANTKYCIIIENTNGDYSNRLEVGHDNTSPTHGGTSTNTGNSYWSWLGTDLCFYVYGDILTSIKAVNKVTQATISKVNGVTNATAKKINGVANQ